MDIFYKCYKYLDVKQHKKMGLHPYFRTVSYSQDTEIEIDGKKLVMLGSCNYMGLNSHPEVQEAAMAAIAKYGSGNVGSPLFNGVLEIHELLEDKLAKFLGKESAVLFGSRYQANVGVLGGLSGSRDFLLLDCMNDSSIFDGGKMSCAKVLKYNHNDMEDLERILKICDNHPGRGKLIVVDGVFGMEGDMVDLPGIVDLAKQYSARVVCDDSHAIGVLGAEGGGVANHFGLTKEVDLIVTTLSTSLASVGAIVAGESDVIDYLKHHARSLIFASSLSAANIASGSKSLDIIRREPERMERLRYIAKKMRRGFRAMGYEMGKSETPIIPIVLQSKEQCMRFWKVIFDEGVFAHPVFPPAVPAGRCLVRMSFMSNHTDRQLEFVLDVFDKARKCLEVA